MLFRKYDALGRVIEKGYNLQDWNTVIFATMDCVVSRILNPRQDKEGNLFSVSPFVLKVNKLCREIREFIPGKKEKLQEKIGFLHKEKVLIAKEKVFTAE